MINNVLLKKPALNIDKVKFDSVSVFDFDQIQTAYHSVTATKLEKSWGRGQSYVSDNFILLVSEFCIGNEQLVYTQQQGYIKFQFRLGGNNTVILDGLGEFTIDRPQLMITAAPEETVKADCLAEGIRYSHVSLCVKRSFFTSNLGLSLEELPQPLRALLSSDYIHHTAHCSSINIDLQSALTALLNVSCSRSVPAAYYEAKAIEIMCLLICQFEQDDPTSNFPGLSSTVKKNRLYEVREMFMLNCAQPLTLTQAASAAGISKTALTTGFRELFGMSVYDFVLQQRMLKAMKLMKASEYSIAQVAEAVGYKQACNFSTAFREYYGCTPNAVRSRSKPAIGL